MGILDNYKAKIADLSEKKRKIEELTPEMPDLLYMSLMLDSKLRDAEAMLNKLTSVPSAIRCCICDKWVDLKLEAALLDINGKKVCPTCLTTISNVYTTQEAEELWGLNTGTIKQDIAREKLQTYVKSQLIRKSGKYWLVHELVKEYYDNKKKD